VPFGQPAHADQRAYAQGLTGILTEHVRPDDRAVVFDRHEALVEHGVQVDGQEDAVVDVEALGVAFAIGPWLDVAGPQQLRHGQAGDGAAALPEIDEALAEDVLPNALNDQALDLGGPRESRGRLLERVEQLVWQGPAELDRASEESVQRRDLGHRAPAGGARRQRRCHGGAVVAER